MVDKHEVVVDRDWLEYLADTLRKLGASKLGDAVSEIAYPTTEEEKD